MRIFAWRYDSRKNYLIYCSYLLFVTLIISLSLMFIKHIADMKRGMGFFIPNDSTSYKIVFKPEDEEEYYLSRCDIISGNKVEYKFQKDLLLRSDNVPLCPGDYIVYTILLVIITFCWLVFIPLGCIVYYDASQFWESIKGKKD